METDEGTDQINQAIAADGERQLVMKEYAWPSLALLCRAYNWVTQAETTSLRMSTSPCYHPFMAYQMKDRWSSYTQ